MSRHARRSRERGLFKTCKHLSWNNGQCPRLGRYRHVRRVNLAVWPGNGKRNLTRSEAIAILIDVRSAVQKNGFDPAGRPRAASTLTVAGLLDDYVVDVEKRADQQRYWPVRDGVSGGVVSPDREAQG
jgi:hypothetical protein